MAASDPTGPAVIVDPFSSGELYAPAFTRAGVPVVAVISRPDPPAAYLSSFHPEDFPHRLTYGGDLAATADQLARLRPRCVLPGTEIGVELADQLAALVVPDVANDPDRIAARRDKGEMARALAAAGLPGLRQISTDDPAAVTAWIRRAGLTGHDLVVKPPKSGSTDGVTRIPAGTDWETAFTGQLGQVNQWGLVNERMVVQEYATGPEYVVDTFSHDGRHTVTDICRYRKTDNGPYMAVYDSLQWLPPDAPEAAELVDYATAVLDAVGMRFGAAHVEVIRTEAGPRLVEVNARPHGGGHPRFCQVATGDSQIDRAVRYFTGGGPIPVHYELRQHMRVVFLIARTAGTIQNVEILDGVRELDSHHHSAIAARNGDRVEVTRDLLATLALGFVVLAHPSPVQLDADYRAVRELERQLVVQPGSTPVAAGQHP